MSNITRRAILAGIVASPAIALAGAASATPEPVSELADFVERFRDVRHRACVATEAREQCAFAVSDTYPKRPRALMGKRQRSDGKSYFYRLDAADINEWYDTQAEIFGIEGARKVALEKKRIALLRRLAWWEKREQAILNASGWPSLKAAEDALDAEDDDLKEKILAYEARTFADVAAKLRFLGYWEPFAEIEVQPENMGIVERTYVALLADVERLAAKGGAA